MKNNSLLIIGSGESLNLLSKNDIEKLNKIKVRVALNKTAYYLNKYGLTYTDVFFTDSFSYTSKYHLRKLIKRNRKNNVNFIISNFWKNKIKYNKIEFYFDFIIFYLKFIKLFIFHNHFKNNRIIYTFKNIWIERPILVKNTNRFIFVSHQQWNKTGNKWAKNIYEDLYHYRGSFSTLLNYVTIKYQDIIVFLIGVDFNSGNYFFQNRINKIKNKFVSEDWTSELTRKEDKHFSIIDFEGTKIDDELPFMIDRLKENHVEMFSLNDQSYLVLNDYVKYKSINDFIDE